MRACGTARMRVGSGLAREVSGMAPTQPRCLYCQQPAMLFRRLHRHGRATVFAGHLLLFPLFLAAVALVLATCIGAWAEDPKAAEAATRFLGGLPCWGLLALALSFPGFLLCARRSVLQCQNCGATVDAGD
jgi:hypothetical protein